MIRGPGRGASEAERDGDEHDDREHGHDHGSHAPLHQGSDDCYVSFAQLCAYAGRWMRGLTAAAGRGRHASWVKPGFYRDRRGRQADAEGGAAELEGPDFPTIVRHVFRYGFVEIADDILFALLVGIALGGVLYLAIPADLMANEYARWLSYPAMVLIGVPLYICASASTPIAAALVAKGVSPGAALVFLMTGPATNTGTIAVIVSQFGARFTTVYVAGVILVTVVLGVLVDVLLLAAGLSIMVNLEASDSPAILALQWGGAIGLAALIVWRFRAGALKSGYHNLMPNT